MNKKAFISLALLGTALGGCTTLGTNVAGSFRCSAPDGVCAPSSVIDDSALARIEETSSTDLLNPAGPYRMDDGSGVPVQGLQGASAPVATSAPTYELAVVFPGYTDATGASYERRVVRTAALLPGRGDAMEAIALRGPSRGRSQGLLAAAESAPPYLAIAPVVMDATPPGSTEGQAKVAAAQAPNPIAQIQSQVSERLAAQQPKARRQAASFPGTVEE
jgi:conjugal transfer pilus assembly protein TraV